MLFLDITQESAELIGRRHRVLLMRYMPFGIWASDKLTNALSMCNVHSNLFGNVFSNFGLRNNATGYQHA
jgi:hypothetical protein